MDRNRLRRRLHAWFLRHRRDLPWRHDRDPYHIWVSEVMLQQTQVATVIPFYRRFLAAFPTLTALARADVQDVLRLWSGLGYYGRARNLHRAAQQLLAAHGEDWPREPEAWRDLPGVGRYILGAVLSQAFDHRMPIVEANSQRVLCRLFGRTDNPRSGPTQRWLWETAADLVPARGAGDFNQALMELGALVCTPAQPRCGECPLAGECVAHQLGLQEQIPLTVRPSPLVEVREAAVVVRRGDAVLMVQRPETGRWAGMWEFPHAELRPEESFEIAAARLVPELTGLTVDPGREITTVRHAVTRFRITMVCFEAQYQQGRFRSAFYGMARWTSTDHLDGFPISSPQRKVVEALRAGPAATAFLGRIGSGMCPAACAARLVDECLLTDRVKYNRRAAGVWRQVFNLPERVASWKLSATTSLHRAKDLMAKNLGGDDGSAP